MTIRHGYVWIWSLLLVGQALGQSGSLFDPENARVSDGRAARGSRTNQEMPSDLAHPLTRQAGPYLIKVASFVGDAHRAYAEALATELREKQRLQTYVYLYQHQVEGLMTDEEAEKFSDAYGIRPRRKVPLSQPPVNWVVLVGDFPAIDDPQAQKTLTKIRKLNVGSVPREIWDQYRINPEGEMRGIAQRRSPLSSAMIVPNPHPQAAKPVKQISPDTVRLILELNSGSPHSVYNNPHPYTLAVAQFQGGSVYGEEKKKSVFGGGSPIAPDKSPLHQAAQQAISIAEALRQLGWEAYVFHGQYASLVCVGGFDDAVEPNKEPDLRVRLHLANQHHEVVEMREKLAEVKIAGMTLSPNAELILTPRPPAGSISAN